MDRAMHEIEHEIVLDKESPLMTGKLNPVSLEIETQNEMEIYIYHCGKALGAITSSIKKTQLSLSLLDIGKLEAISSKDDPISEYIIMLIENSIIRVQSIYDRVLIFTNMIYDLGISNECIKHVLLVTNKHIKDDNLENKLKAINKACNDYRLARNTIIHHGRYTEEQLDRLTLFIDSNHLAAQTGGDLIMKPELLKEITDSYLEAKQEEFVKYLDQIERKIFDFYDSIIPVYKRQKEQLRPR
jgi:hypothetical protein